MSYIGKAPGFGIRNRYYYTATSSQTLFSGADDNGQTLAYADSKYLDVYLNGVLLVAGTDYTATTLTSVSLTTGASASDIVEIIAYDIFSVADTVSAANGGTFNGAVTVDSTLTASGLVTAQDGLVVDNDGATVATFDRATSDGTIAEFQKDGSTVGTIGNRSNALQISGDAGAGFDLGGGSILPLWNGSLDTGGNVSLGDSTREYADLYLSGGVVFGSTGGSVTSKTLGDYEEGTWTPTVFGQSSAGTTTYSLQQGSYIKIGSKVTVSARLAYSAVTGTGELRFGGFPFASRNDLMEYMGAIMTNNLNWSGGTSIALYVVPATTSSVIFGSTDNAGWSAQQCVNESANIIFTVTYFTDS